MMIYLDASALVKCYVLEDGSAVMRRAVQDSSSLFMCQIGFVETSRALSMAGSKTEATNFERDWREINSVAVDQRLVEDAADFADSYGLRALDALHLAAAATLPMLDVVVATWDKRLHEAAQRMGLRTLPEALA